MEVKILREGKNMIELQIEGETHTLCNILKEELKNDSKVKIAAYKVEHPLVGVPTLFVETDGSETPKQAISKAISKLSSKADDLKKMLAKELK